MGSNNYEVKYIPKKELTFDVSDKTKLIFFPTDVECLEWLEENKNENLIVYTKQI